MSYASFNDEATYRANLLQVLQLAQHEIAILDRDLTGMRPETSTFLNALAKFCARERGNRVLLAVHVVEPLQQTMPRLLALCQRHMPAIEVRHVINEYRHLADCHLLADGRHGVRRFHHDHARGALLLDDAIEIAPWWRRFGELWSQLPPVSLLAPTGL